MDNTNPLNPQVPAQPVSQTPVTPVTATPVTPAAPPVAPPAVVKPVMAAVPAATVTPPAPVQIAPPVAAPIPAVPKPAMPVAPAPAPIPAAPKPIAAPVAPAAPVATFQLPTQQKPVVSTPAPIPTPTPVTPQPVPQTATAAAVRAGGSLFKKLALAVTIVVVFGSAIGLGYSMFPETFYNNFGKFIGLPAPAGVEENIAADVIAPENTDTQKASAPEVVDLNTLMEALPGADANLVAYFNATEVSRDGIKKLTTELEKYFVPAATTETSGAAAAEDELANTLSQVEAFVLVAKFEQLDLAQDSSALAKASPPAAVAIKVAKENESKFLEKLNSLKASPNSQAELAAVTFEGDGNGMILVKNSADKLTGKASEGSLAKKLLETKDVNFALGVDVKSLAKTATAPATEAAASTDTAVVATLNTSGQNPFEDLAKIESAIITANFEYANDQYSFKVNAISSFADDATASDVLTKTLQPQLKQFESFMPADFKAFFVFNSFAEAKNITVTAEVKDFVGLTQKLIQARDSLQAADTKKQEDLKNITTDTAPAADGSGNDAQVLPVTPDVPAVTAPTEPSAPATGVKVPRKKPVSATSPTPDPGATPAQ